MTRASALVDFFALIGWEPFPAPASDDAPPEAHLDYRRSGTIAADRAATVAAEDYLALQETFGDALDLHLWNDHGHVSVRDDCLEVAPGDVDEVERFALASPDERLVARAALDPALAELAVLDVTLDLVIRKARLGERIRRERGWDADSPHIVYYLFAHYLVAVLEREGLRVLDSAFFAAPARPTVVVVADQEALLYRGDLLIIIDEAQLAGLAEPDALVGAPAPAAIAKYQETLRERLSLDFPLRHVTPLHLLCTSTGSEVAALTRALHRALFHLSVLYTANRSQRREPAAQASNDAPDYLALYHDRNRAARVALGRHDTVALAPDALAEFARWPYEGEGRSDDRLDVLQKTFAQALVGAAAENTQSLLGSLPALLMEVKTQYGFFIDDQLDEFYKQRQGIADYAADVAKKVADGVEAVTKGLVDTALATVAAIAVAVLAAVANDKVRGLTFTVILSIYAAYVFLQALYRMSSAAHSMSLLRDEATTRLQGSAQQLGERTVQPLRDMLKRRWEQFRRWGVVTAVAYIIIAILILLLGVLGPRSTALRDVAPTPTAGTQQPAPTATASPPPVPSPSSAP